MSSMCIAIVYVVEIRINEKIISVRIIAQLKLNYSKYQLEFQLFQDQTDKCVKVYYNYNIYKKYLCLLYIYR